MENMKVSDQIALFLKNNEIEVVFGIIGAGIAHVFDSIEKLGYTKIVSVHHEQAAVMAMGAYYRVSGKLSASLVTTGGGSSNAVTGVVSCWMDSIPGIIISGNEKSQFTTSENLLRIWGVQGYDSVAMVEKTTKLAKRLTDPKRVYAELGIAKDVALSDRKGPVWLDVPMDIQSQRCDLVIEPKMEKVAEPNSVSVYNSLEGADNLLKLLANSKRPVLWLGHGIRLAGAEDLIEDLLERLRIPALISWQGIDMIDSNNPYVFGRAGVYGQRYSNFIVQNSDLVICIGTRMAYPQIGYDINEFAREAKVVAVDIDPIELNKFKDRLDISVCADAGDFIRAILDKTKNESICDVSEWHSKCLEYKEKFPKIASEHEDTNGFMNSYRFMDRLNKDISANEIIVTDMGTALLSAHQVLDIVPPQRLITSTGLGEMGYGLPAAIGASFGSDKGQVLCLNCDGGMMMNLQELQTVIHHGLPIKIVIFNNDGYLMIKNSQKSLFGGRYTCADATSGVTCPDYTKVGKAFGFDTYQLHNWDDYETHFAEFMNNPKASICEVFMDPEQPCLPKLGVAINSKGELISPPLEDLSPFISREEFKKSMIIDPMEKSLNIDS
ncbi:thiamine pyrophosphate-binding protein [Vibrio anguillarum]|uniref:Thiamine pyrophosphate-binding protein n=2 Tax=Vibrio anguillarum TaxID=55601 RepID=A0ABD4QUD7_VIBAN|nr:thiamine pyrophosphate-binding protein [Vibrio anguillarum]ASG04772.1 thiamine pyrophosphate-binding protein [Vibrio anguillarum]MBF4244683.1 thiamine pyrophosphate-binding protein [Vibrio anguillarum]MBT2918491.1 thiamine pyrophosphate-binding protein [Vibrio anguillarum]